MREGSPSFGVFRIDEYVVSIGIGANLRGDSEESAMTVTVGGFVIASRLSTVVFWPGRVFCTHAAGCYQFLGIYVRAMFGRGSLL